MLGGAVGNLLVRMLGGSVIDMVHVTWWPTFNLADVAICAGAALIVVDGARREIRGHRAEQSASRSWSAVACPRPAR